VNLTTDEIALYVEWDKLRAAYLDAKETEERGSPKYEKAKKAFSEFRTYWREIRTAFEPEVADGDAVAAPAALAVASAANKKGS
jgi:hypothetical protein